MRHLLPALLALSACDAVVSDLGQAEQPPAPVSSSTPRIARLSCTPNSGMRPLTVQCALDVSQVDGKATSCVVDPGDGRATIPVVDCLAPQTFTFTFDREGSFVLRAVATTPETSEGISASVGIEVQPQPDQPPKIDSFTAAPPSGVAPLNTTLSWKVSDPEGDPLTCAIDGASVDCAGSKPFSTSTLGPTTVTLTVTDSHGLSTSQSLTVTVRDAVGDVKVTRAEWGQSVIAASPKLVAGKPALLRVYVLGDKAGLPTLSVEVTGTLDGGTLGPVKLLGPASPPTAEAIDKLDQQYKATLPAEWIAPGVTLSIKADPGDTIPETDETNNELQLTPTVGKGNVLPVTAVPVVQGGLTGTVRELNGAVTAVWPVKSVEQTTRAAYTYGGAPLTGGNTAGWGDLLDEIGALRQADGSNRNYYAFVKVNYQAGVAGIGFIGQGSAVGRDDSMDTAAHELGHNMGRQHAPCGGAAGPDPQYPYAGAFIGSWGYDAAAQKLMPPSGYKDLMSYCDPSWVSDYNYKAVQSFLEARPQTFVTSAAPFVKSLLLTGSVDDASGAVALKPVHSLLAAPTVPDDASPLVVRLTLADGRTVQQPVALVELAEGGRHHFTAVVADPGPLARLEVLLAGKVMLTRSTLQQPADPQVQVVADGSSAVKVSWNPSLPYAAVSYVNSAGRVTLSLSLSGGGGVVSTAGLERTDDGRFEVSTSDGLNARSQLVR